MTRSQRTVPPLLVFLVAASAAAFVAARLLGG